MFDLQLPFFEALWRRIATIVVALGWAAFELANGAAGWAMLFAAMGGWAIYQFFVVWDAETVAARKEAARKGDPQ
jgi:hypothetical protein